MNIPQELALTFVALVSIFGVGILAWGAWVGLWGLYDGLMQRRKRRLNNFDARVGRDCYRFIKGVHH